MHPKIQEGNFHESINRAITEERHVEYLQEVLKKYKEYKLEFEKNFTDKNPKDAVYAFRATYLLKRPVWRDIAILGTQTFCDLAETIIESMCWDNDHMHGFEFLDTRKRPDPLFTGSSIAFFAPGWEDDPHPTFKTDEIRICDLDYSRHPRLEFMFDFGDGHRFDVKLKGTRHVDKQETARDFPRVIDQRGVAPEQYPALD
ncbi:MAG: hypothetical protein WC659_01820 [Patescibacteria group bacterium]